VQTAVRLAAGRETTDDEIETGLGLLPEVVAGLRA